MSNYADFLSRISTLDNNISIPIPIGQQVTETLQQDFAASDAAFFTTSHGFETGLQTMYEPAPISQFQSPSIASGTDLSVFVEALKQSSKGLRRRVHRKPPLARGIPLQFFKDTNITLASHLVSPDSAQTFYVSEKSEPSLSSALDLYPDGSILVLKPGIYQEKYVISRSCTLRAEGEVIFDTDSPAFSINGGEVIFEGIYIQHGKIVVNGGKLQLVNCKITATVFAHSEAQLMCRGVAFAPNDENCISLQSAICTCIDCDFRNRAVFASKQSSLFIAKSRLENMNDNGLSVDESICRVEDSSIGDCSKSCVLAAGQSDIVITGTSIFNCENGNLVEISSGAIMKVKNCRLSSSCINAIHISLGASLLCENIELKRNCNVESDGLLELKQCQIFTITCKTAHLILNKCDILSTSGSGLVSNGFSDIVLEGSVFHNCRSNGLEVSDQTAITATNCKFIQNSCGGASVSSTSAMFKNCLFSGNALVGVEVVGEGASPVFESCSFTENAAVDATCYQETSPIFKSCKFYKSDQLSVAIVGSYATLEKCSFNDSQNVAVDIRSEGSPKFTDCTFDGCSMYSIQLQDEKTFANFDRCTFKNNKKGSVVLSFGHSSANFTSCNFTNSGLCHLEVRDEAHVYLDGCVLAECAGGIGIFVHAAGITEMNRTIIKDVEKAGMFVGPRGKVILTECEIFGCGEVGIAAELQSVVTARQCVIKHNGKAGIQAEGGDITIDQCTIEEHSDFGIYATALAAVVQTGNSFNANAKGDTQIG